MRSHPTVVVLCLVTMFAAAPACDDPAEARRWRDYIRGDRYTRLIIEVDYVEGSAPNVENRIAPPLSALLDKPDGIDLVVDDVLPPTPGRVWTLEALEDLMDAHDDVALDAATIKINTLIVGGSYLAGDADGTVLGISWGGHRVVLFADSIASSCAIGAPGVPADLLCRAVRNAVWMHEIGHLLGLVDNGLPMVSPHRDADPSHGSHDANPDCLMYWATQRHAVVERVIRSIASGGGDHPLEFDDACKADIAAVRDAE